MKGVIIAGGFGTRLRPLTFHRPKHLLPVANRPFLEYQVALLRKHGIREIVFASNYLWQQIEAHFGDGSGFGVSMRYALEPEPLGTAGAIRNAYRLTGPEPLFVLNGDVLTDFDLGEIIEFHHDKRAEATIALRAVDRPHAFGVIDADSAGRLLDWREPSEEDKNRVAAGEGDADGESDNINAGIYILEPSFVERIPPGRAVSIERETFPAALAEGRSIYATLPAGYWLDIGNPRQYLAANTAVLSGKVETDLTCAAVHPSASIGPGSAVSADSAIGPNSTIGADCVIDRSVILDGVRIGNGCTIRGAILDSDVEIESGRIVQQGEVLSAHA